MKVKTSFVSRPTTVSSEMLSICDTSRTLFNCESLLVCPQELQFILQYRNREVEGMIAPSSYSMNYSKLRENLEELIDTSLAVVSKLCSFSASENFNLVGSFMQMKLI